MNTNVTNILLSNVTNISCDLDAMDQQVEHSLIQTFLLLKQILWFLGCLFYEKSYRYLELFP